jgi:hypothetical protein
LNTQSRINVTEVGEGGFAVEPGDILDGGDQGLAVMMGADTEQGDGAWGDRTDELVELLIQLSDLGDEGPNATGHGVHRQLGDLQRTRQLAPIRAQVSADASLPVELSCGTATRRAWLSRLR